jgi:tetratricopeptide (TPR) repeat protein
MAGAQDHGPKRPPGYAGELAAILAAQGRPEEAEKAFRLAIADEPAKVEWHAGLAEALIAQARQEEAVPALIDATALDPSRADLFNELGLIEVHPAKAEEAFRAAIAADPACAIYQANLAVCLIDQWRLDEAEACFHEAIRLQPSDLSYSIDLGHLLIDMGRFADAELLFRRTLWSVPQTALLDGPAWTAYGAGRFDDADALFGKRACSEQDDRLAWGYRGRGIALLAMGQDREAIVSLRAAVSLAPREPTFHQELGEALRAGGRESAASVALARARELRAAALKARPPTRRPITLTGR